MANKKKKRAYTDKFRVEMQSFADELSKESDRSVAILGIALLDRVLEELLVTCFVDDMNAARDIMEGKYAPLNSFSSRIDMAYCLGLIPQNIKKDLDIVRGIRNGFAHELHGLSFETEDIKKEVLKIQIINVLLDNRPPDNTESLSTPRSKFLVAIVLLNGMLGQEVDSRAGKKPAQPEDFAFKGELTDKSILDEDNPPPVYQLYVG